MKYFGGGDEDILSVDGDLHRLISNI